jgi:DNA primase
VTNPDKVLFPDTGYTKRDLVDYYVAVGDGIVRALRERPTQLRRFPDGIAGEQIYQKRVPEKRPDWVEVTRATFPRDVMRTSSASRSSRRSCGARISP